MTGKRWGLHYRSEKAQLFKAPSPPLQAISNAPASASGFIASAYVKCDPANMTLSSSPQAIACSEHEDKLLHPSAKGNIATVQLDRGQTRPLPHKYVPKRRESRSE